MAEAKTKPTAASVTTFLERIPDEARRADCFTILRLMKQATRAEPKMWGTSIVGFGSRTLVYASGREADWPIIGFSPRKQDLTLYIGDIIQRSALMKKLGKHKTSRGCLYIKRLEDVELPVLKALIGESVKGKKEKGA